LVTLETDNGLTRCNGGRRPAYHDPIHPNNRGDGMHAWLCENPVGV